MRKAKYSLPILAMRECSFEGAVSNSDTVSVISDTTNTVVAKITVGNSPCDIAYDPAKNEVFVYNSGGNGSAPYISLISDSNKRARQIQLQSFPRFRC